MKDESKNKLDCLPKIVGIKDTMGILSGKWKFHIIGTLMVHGKLRFKDLLLEVEGIGTKMLAKELKDLELNILISRTVINSKRPITVEYEITSYGQTLECIIEEIATWGIEYRKSIYGNHKK